MKKEVMLIATFIIISALAGCAFFDGSNGLATSNDADGHSSIYKTADGGFSWKSEELSH